MLYEACHGWPVEAQNPGLILMKPNSIIRLLIAAAQQPHVISSTVLDRLIRPVVQLPTSPI